MMELRHNRKDPPATDLPRGLIVSFAATTATTATPWTLPKMQTQTNTPQPAKATGH